MSGKIDYGNLMHEAMRGLIRRVLSDVARDGLPGEHHFFITFNTLHPGVEIADWLAERYPGEMTIVMQHWFDNLEVGDDGFSVTLNFGDNPEPLYIPFDSILTFVDPSVEFGLRFETQDEAKPERSAPPAPAPAPDDTPAGTADGAATAQGGAAQADVVSLDSFRKS